MRILITGGAGFIGSHLGRLFIEKGAEVFVVDNLVTGNKKNIGDLLKNDGFHFFEKDIVSYDYKDLPSFDIVYDLASPASPKVFDRLSLEIIRVNSLGLIKLLDFFVKSKSKTFVFASTSEVYGDPKVNPQPEEYFGNVNPFGPRACYDEGKRFAEAIIFSYRQKFRLDLRIARIFNTYGPNMDPEDGRVISNFITQALKNKPMTIYGDGRQTRSCCFVSDMVNGLYLLGTKGNLEKPIINIGNPDERSVLEIAGLIKTITKSRSKIVFLQIGKDDPKVRCPRITRAEKILGWSPTVDFETGLGLTADYFKNI